VYALGCAVEVLLINFFLSENIPPTANQLCHEKFKTPYNSNGPVSGFKNIKHYLFNVVRRVLQQAKSRLN